jgi:hypothetical protein
MFPGTRDKHAKNLRRLVLLGEVERRKKPRRLSRVLRRDVLGAKGLSIRTEGVII